MPRPRECDLCAEHRQEEDRAVSRRLVHLERTPMFKDEGGLRMCSMHWMQYAELETQQLAKKHGWDRPKPRPTDWLDRAIEKREAAR